MRQYLTAEVVANTVSMLRTAFRGTIVLMESDSDTRVLARFAVGQERCRLVPSAGKDNALRAQSILRSRGHARHLLLVLDADFWHLSGAVPDDDDIVVTQFHDLEMDMVASDAFEVVLAEVADASRQAELERSTGLDTRTTIAQLAASVGLYRYVAQRYRLMLSFRQVRLEAYVRRKPLGLRLDDYLADLLDGADGGSRRELEQRARSIHVRDGELFQMCQGHDFCAILGVALQEAIGCCDGGVADGSHVEAMLRMSYAREHFERSLLSVQIQEWEERNDTTVLA